MDILRFSLIQICSFWFAVVWSGEPDVTSCMCWWVKILLWITVLLRAHRFASHSMFSFFSPVSNHSIIPLYWALTISDLVFRFPIRMFSCLPRKFSAMNLILIKPVYIMFAATIIECITLDAIRCDPLLVWRAAIQLVGCAFHFLLHDQNTIAPARNLIFLSNLRPMCSTFPSSAKLWLLIYSPIWLILPVSQNVRTLHVPMLVIALITRRDVRSKKRHNSSIWRPRRDFKCPKCFFYDLCCF